MIANGVMRAAKNLEDNGRYPAAWHVTYSLLTCEAWLHTKKLSLLSTEVFRDLCKYAFNNRGLSLQRHQDFARIPSQDLTLCKIDASLADKLVCEIIAKRLT